MRILIAGVFLFSIISFSRGQGYALSDIPFTRNGVEYKYPFAGGMNSPQFSEIDLNRDGLSDIFVFDRVGSRVTTYVRTEANTLNFDYAPQYESLFPQLNDWALVRDYNKDGIPDLIVSDHIPTVFGVQVYTGKWVDGHISFDLFQFTNGNFNVVFFESEQGSIQQLEVLSSDLPVIDDVDFDGDIDILKFGSSGTYLEFIQNQSVEMGFGSDSLIFKRVDECWGKFFESGDVSAAIDLSSDSTQCFANGFSGGIVSSRHVGSTSTAIDANRDGLMDLIIGDVSSEGMIFLNNTGSTQNAWITASDLNFPSSDIPIALKTFLAAYSVDANDDGKKDLIISPNENLNTENIEVAHLYLDNGSQNASSYERVSTKFLIEGMIDISQGSRPAIVDYNADGLQDIVVGTYGILDTDGFTAGRLFLFENIGSANTPAYELVNDNWLNFTQFGSQFFYLTPTFGDIDGDGDIDLLIGNQSGRMIYYNNNAGPNNALNFDSPLFDYKDIDVGGHCNPSIVDIDGDGLMDLVIGEENGNRTPDQTDICSHLSFFRNIGSNLAPDFNSDINAGVNISCFGDVRTDDMNLSRRGYASPQFLNLNGELVLLVGGRRGKVLVYNHINDQNEPFNLLLPALGNIDVGERSHPILWDLNGDNLLELIVGNLAGGLIIYDSDLTLDQIVAVKDIADESSLVIYPNPTSDLLFIETDSDLIQLSIISTSGKTIIYLDDFKDHSILLNELKPGIYFIIIKTNEKLITRKFIKI